MKTYSFYEPGNLIRLKFGSNLYLILGVFPDYVYVRDIDSATCWDIYNKRLERDFVVIN